MEPADHNGATLDEHHIEREHSDKAYPLTEHQAPTLHRLGGNGMNGTGGNLPESVSQEVSTAISEVIMTRDQVLAVLKAAREASERDFIMILLAYRHGLRSSEVCSLHKTRNFSDGYITVKRLKGSEKTSQPLFSSDNPLLDEGTAVTRYLETVPKGFLFPARQTSTTVSPHLSRQAYHTLFQLHCQTAGIPKHLRHPHAMKHSIAMELVKKVDIAELQTFLGHKSLSSTGQYLRVSQQQACDAVAAAMSF